MAESTSKSELTFRRESRLLGPKGKVLTVASLILVGSALSIGSFVTSKELERRSIEVQFLRDAEERTSVFKIELARSLNVVVALRAFFDSSVRVEPAEFRQFARQMMSEDRAIQGLGWNANVLDSQRESFEATQRQEVRPDFRISEKSAAGELVPAARRERYVAVTYLEPYEGNEAALGYDIASDPVRLQALRTAERTKGTAITAGIRLVQEAGEEIGFLAVHPWYANLDSADEDDRSRGGLLGFLVAVLRPVDIFKTALAGFAPRGLHFSVHDVTDGNDVLLYAHQSLPDSDISTRPADGAARYEGFFYEEQIAVPGRNWVIRSAPVAAYVTGRRSWTPLAALIMGLLVTGVITTSVSHALGRLGREREHAEKLLVIGRNLEEEAEERQKTAMALAESDEKYRVVVEAMFEGVVVSEKGIFVEVSDGLRELFGYEESEVIGEPVLTVVAPKEHNRVARRMRTGYDQPYETVCVKKNGTCFPVEVCGRESLRNGRPVRITAVRDLTKQKRLEQEVLRGRKLESLGVLAGGLAHDFNNLLTGILGNIDLAKLNPGGEETLGVLDEAERATLHARDLTQQLLTFARGGAPVAQLTDLGELARESAVFALRGGNVKAEFEIPDDLWAAQVDPGQINQVVQNLVLNATQAMPEGGTIRLRCRNVELENEEPSALEAGLYLELSIEDEGVGIAAEDLDSVFDPYVTTKESGRGLGLAMVFSIVKNHAGGVEMESEVGSGTIVRVLLPATGEPFVGSEDEAEEAARGSGSVLVMDDEPMVRKVLAAMLERLGYQVTCVGTGEEAVETYRRALGEGVPFAACIMDLTVVGGMGGKMGLDRLKEIDPEVRAIVSSGYSNDPVLADYAEFGFCGVIPKPYRLQDVGKALRQARDDNAKQPAKA